MRCVPPYISHYQNSAFCVSVQVPEKLSQELITIKDASLREASEASGSGKFFYPIQERETQKAAVSSTLFQIRSEAHGAYILL